MIFRKKKIKYYINGNSPYLVDFKNKTIYSPESDILDWDSNIKKIRKYKEVDSYAYDKYMVNYQLDKKYIIPSEYDILKDLKFLDYAYKLSRKSDNTSLGYVIHRGKIKKIISVYGFADNSYILDDNGNKVYTIYNYCVFMNKIPIIESREFKINNLIKNIK